MKISVEGKQYDWPVMPFIGDLRLLKPEFGFGWGTVMERMTSLEGETPLHMLLDEPEFVEAFAASILMAMLRAGERDTTAAYVRQLPLDQVFIVVEDSDEPAAPPDPTPAPTDSEPGGDKPRAARKSPPSTSRTSRKRSTPASP